MSTGPFLYDDGPPTPFTGTPRRRNGLIVALVLGTVLVAVGMVGAMLLIRGTPGEQAEEVAGVFLTALHRGDSETAYGLLCEEERARVAPEDVAGEYGRGRRGAVVGSAETEVHGRAVQRVEVRWADGETNALILVAESGPRVCGTA